ncbi:hypothetical protein, partial [Nonomuraea sp. NPDC049709]|uniref:hypothetical protein n=1 Tax=Nonomuraea sp. NPDC049709 TaxID=3154736 RepID=UPI0034332CA8
MTAVALPRAHAPARTARLTPALLRFEAVRLARSPALWTAAAAFLALRIFYTWQWLPDMNSEPVVTMTTSLLIAATVLILAGLGAARDGRNGLAETLAAVPGEAAVRTWAVAVAAAAVGASVCALVMGVHLAVRLLASGTVAGRADPYELAGGVAVTALAAVFGVALGRWVPSLIAGPLAVVVLGVLSFLGVSLDPGRWLLPAVMVHEPQWGTRPSGWHALYLLGLVVLFGALAMLRHGVRPRRCAAAVAGLAVAV